MSKPFYATLPFLGPTTAASIAAAPGPGPTNGLFVYVDEFAATYKWTAGSVVAADGYRVLSHTGGVAGRWILESNNLTLAPSRGATWTTLGAAMTSMAYKGSVTLAAEAWTADVEISTPNGTHLIIETGATINSTIAFSPGTIPQNAVFYNNGGTTAPTATTTLGVNAAFGATVLTLTNATGFNVGGWFRILQGVAYTRTYKILAKAGNDVTIDRSLRRPFTAGATCEAISAALDVTVEGNGVTITGQADALIQVASAVNCHYLDINATSWTGKGFGVSIDLGSRDSTLDNIFVDRLGTGLAQQGILLANTENIDIYDCRAIRATGVCLSVASSDNFHCWGGSFTQCTGLGVCILDVEDASDPYGTRGSIFSGVYFGSGSGAGVLTQNGSSFNTWDGCESSDNQSGWSFPNSAAAPNGNTIQGGVARRNTQAHVLNAGGTNKIIGLSCAEGPVGCISVTTGATLNCIGVQSLDTSAAAAAQSIFIVNGAGSVLNASGCLATTNRGGHHMFEVQASGRLTINGGTRFTATGANCAGVFMNGATTTVRIDEFTLVSGAYGVYLNNASAYCRRGSNVNVSTAATAAYFSAAGQFNFGTVSLDDNNPVAVNFGDTNAQDNLYWSYGNSGTASGIVVVGAPTPGTGFSIVSVIGDKSVIVYKIEGG